MIDISPCNLLINSYLSLEYDSPVLKETETLEGIT